MSEIDRRAWDPFAPAPSSPAPAAPSVSERDGDDLDDLKKADLVALADKRDLDTTGTRAELIARLRGQD